MLEALARLAGWLGALKASEWIGIYGAALSTALAVAKAWSYFSGPRSVVRVELEVAPATGDDPAPLYRVTVVNRSIHEITVTALEALAAGPGSRWRVGAAAVSGQHLPRQVAARASWHVAFTARQLVGADDVAFRRVAARLATGERVKSGSVRQRRDARTS